MVGDMHLGVGHAAAMLRWTCVMGLGVARLRDESVSMSACPHVALLRDESVSMSACPHVALLRDESVSMSACERARAHMHCARTRAGL